MLKKVRQPRAFSRLTGRFAIVASRYNARYVEGMLLGAESVLQNAGAGRAQVVRVPGSFEIPVVAAQLARRKRQPFAAIICLGVIFRGETGHADLIAQAISHALAQVQIETGVPVIHEVLLLENESQAEIRCLDDEHNRGAEAAATAVEMAGIMAALPTR